MIESVRARLYEDPDAEIGDTAIDSDEIISLYIDTLTPQEFKKFSWNKAEEKIFDKLKEIEKIYFKEKKEGKQAPEEKTKPLSLFNSKDLRTAFIDAIAEVFAEAIK